MQFNCCKSLAYRQQTGLTSSCASWSNLSLDAFRSVLGGLVCLLFQIVLIVFVIYTAYCCGVGVPSWASKRLQGAHLNERRQNVCPSSSIQEFSCQSVPRFVVFQSFSPCSIFMVRVLNKEEIIKWSILWLVRLFVESALFFNGFGVSKHCLQIGNGVTNGKWDMDIS